MKVEEHGEDPLALIEALLAGPRAALGFGEPVPMEVHLRQSAALAQAEHGAPALVAAALLHDVAYLLSSDRALGAAFEARHAAIGASWIGQWFDASVSGAVRLHAEAKRYLVASDPAYRAALSEESERTLVLQGGPMSAEEMANFEAEPSFEAAVALRRIDDRAKDPTVVPPPVAHFAPLLSALLAPQPPPETVTRGLDPTPGSVRAAPGSRPTMR